MTESPSLETRLREMSERLAQYLEYCGAIHDVDCPEDDTCDCAWKPVNDAANEAYRFIKDEAAETIVSLHQQLAERSAVKREWKSIDEWVSRRRMSAAPESTASDHYYIDGFNAGLREGAQMWRDERERWAQVKDQLAAAEARIATLEQLLRKWLAPIHPEFGAVTNLPIVETRHALGIGAATDQESGR
jgi:hypothetical protein